MSQSTWFEQTTSRRSQVIVADPIIAVDALDDDTRRGLGETLYDIFSRSYGALDLDTVCAEIIFKRGGELALFRGDRGAIVGFATFRVSPFSCAGRKIGVVEAGAYFVPGVRGGRLAGWFGVCQAAKYKLRHPRTPLVYVCEALTAATYRRLTRTVPRLWPRRQEATPPKYIALLRDIMVQRGFAPDAERPYIARYGDSVTHENAADLDRSTTLRDDPDAQFYLASNPCFAAGDILFCIVPLGAAELVLAVASHITHTIKRTLS